MILERQTTPARERIHQAIITGAERFRQGEQIGIAIRALMVTAVNHTKGYRHSESAGIKFFPKRRSGGAANQPEVFST